MDYISKAAMDMAAFWCKDELVEEAGRLFQQILKLITVFHIRFLVNMGDVFTQS